MKGKVIGIGGIFFKCRNPEITKNWYAEKLGISTDQWGASFVSKKVSQPDQNAYLQWSPFPKETTYFLPSDQEYMINYRVEHIEILVDHLKSSGVTICDEIMSYEYGKFVHILDEEGHKVELWEPIDHIFDDMYKDFSKLNAE